MFGEHISSRSERVITPEAAWMAKQGYKWSESEEEEEPIPAAETDEELDE